MLRAAPLWTWALRLGLWTLGFVLWTLDFGLWALGFGPLEKRRPGSSITATPPMAAPADERILRDGPAGSETCRVGAG